MSSEKLSAIYRNEVLELHIPLNFYLSNSTNFRIFKEDECVLEITSNSRVHSSNSFILFFNTKDITFIPGIEYFLVTSDNFFVPIDFSSLALDNKAFEEKYRYDGKLGLTYSKEKSIFRLFSPFASQIILVIQKYNSKQKQSFIMNHNLDNGIFDITILGDYEKAKYHFLVTLFSTTYKVIDPYSFSTDANARNSFVIDVEKIKSIPSNNQYLDKYLGPTASIIYETNVRDMTSLTSLSNKGTYLGLVEHHKEEAGMKVGIDYLNYIKPTHVQLQPILDFQTVDENNPFSSYNWGYDPLMFFSLEGSYSSNPNDPYARLKEARMMVSQLHKSNLRVVLDVVYNHVFSDKYNPLSILVPNYYYRLNKDLTLSKGSGCGNELESRNYMVRKLIIDSTLYLLSLLDIDGFRFDLSALIDIETLNLLAKKVKSLKKNFIFIGEGWSLGTSLRSEECSSMQNAEWLPDFAFFNDRYRDVVKGGSSESSLHIQGYLLGDTNYFDGFKHTFLGSTNSIAFAPLFKNVNQTVNFVECHDNYTLYDKIKCAIPDASEEEILTRIKMINTAIIFSVGIPFIHMGQEFGQSKNMEGNTYNAGDYINGFNYQVASERKELIEFFSHLVKLKKEFIVLAGDDYKKITDYIIFDSLPGGAIKITFSLKKCNYYLIFNPTREMFMYSFDEKIIHLLSSDSNSLSQNNLYLSKINPVSVNIYKSKVKK